MYDVTELYDDLAAIRHAQSILPDTVAQETRSDLQVVIKRIEGKLSIALNLLWEDERHDIMYELDGDYCGGVWAELEALL